MDFIDNVYEVANLYQFDLNFDGLDDPRPIGAEGYCVQCGEYVDQHSGSEEAEPCYECGCRTVFAIGRIEDLVLEGKIK